MRAELLNKPALAYVGLRADDVSPKALRTLTACFPGAQWLPAGVFNDVAKAQGRNTVDDLVALIGVEAPQPADFLTEVANAIPGLLFWTGEQVEGPLGAALGARQAVGLPDDSPKGV